MDIKLTKNEKSLIKFVFDSCKSFWKKAGKDLLSVDNISDVTWALKYAHDVRGIINGVQNHDIMHGIYDKVGLWTDGITTKKEREILMKAATERAIKRREIAMNDNINKRRKVILKLEKEITDIKKSHENVDIDIDKKLIENQMQLKLEADELRKRKHAEVQNKHERYLEAVGAEPITEDKKKPEVVQEPESEPEIEPELDLESLTVAQLKLLADDGKIVYGPKVLKAGLIDLIKKSIEQA